jgi:hypothetical protein
VVHCCGSSACGARLVAQRCVVCTAVVAVRQLHSWPRPGAFWALLLDHLKSCENPTSSGAAPTRNVEFVISRSRSTREGKPNAQCGKRPGGVSSRSFTAGGRRTDSRAWEVAVR